MSWREICKKIYDRVCSLASYMPALGNFQPIRRWFSAYDKIKNGELKGEIIAEKQDIGTCLPKSMTDLCGFKQHDHQPWPIFWAKTNDARLIGKLRVWRDRENSACLEGTYGYRNTIRTNEDRLFSQQFLTTEKKLSGAWTSIVSNWGDGKNYYHWLFDNLTRLHVREHLPEETKILVPQNLPAYAKDSLELLGLSSFCESPSELHLAPERFYFCSPMAMTGVWNPLGYTWLKKSFAPYFKHENKSSVFLTRRAKLRNLPNIDEIEELFSSYGFRIVDCGKISFKEQIEIASNASCLAGIHGAAMSNILWCAPHTPVLEIFDSNYLNGCYEQIANHGELLYQFIIFENINSLSKSLIKYIESNAS